MRRLRSDVSHRFHRPVLWLRRHLHLNRCCPNPHSFIAFSRPRGAFRSFLLRGLSNTCPQAVVVSGAVISHGQVSDNPKLQQPDMLTSRPAGHCYFAVVRENQFLEVPRYLKKVARFR
jgi:hypothetical protein